MLARRPVCLLRVFWVYNKFADSDDVVIGKQDFSIVDTHEPTIAMTLSPVCFYVVNPYSYKIQIFLSGRHQGVRPSVSRITWLTSRQLVVIARCRAMKMKDVR